eukprot:TRINITY_DN3004_c1_g2_i2.p1 TRINITY_DN3004_c1_g2~~TRINITY_DN3004_c1_g2_i2.p1  ORF type:complete len:916 (+),score=318.62 TRINITY_DN3004_c1_g2_i2:68-2749(+)
MPEIKVLCLHGCHQDAEIFSQRLQQLQRRSKGTLILHYAEAPFELPLGEGEEVPMRSWWRSGPRRELPTEDLLAAAAAARRGWEQAGGCEGLLGFSQGAGLAALLLLLAEGGAECAAWLRGRCRFAVLAGGLLTEAELAAAATLGAGCGGLQAALPTLHFAGERDPVVSCAESDALARLLGEEGAVRHPQGHVFPQRVSDIEAVLRTAREAAAAGALRIDPADGAAYGLADFIAEYGGTARCPPAEWLEAVVVPAARGEGGESSEEEERPSAAPPGADRGDGELPGEAAEELETLESIYGDAVQRLGGRRVSTSAEVEGGAYEGCGFAVDYVLPRAYPAAPPLLTFRETRGKAGWLTKSRWYSALQAEGRRAAAEACGGPAIWAVLDAVREFIEGRDGDEAAPAPADEETPAQRALQAMQDETDEAREEHARAAMAAAGAVPVGGEDWTAAWGRGGEWKFVIGLVGKPSAGKSTLFNAATGDDQAARVAAHPFTTIEPNLGEGYAPCPSPHREYGLSDAECGALHGLTAAPADGSPPQRFVPVQIRDVAGLVPGAYQGRGKGNRFLDDLVGADVLIQVVDASGATDSEGNARELGGGGSERPADVVDEIRWVRAEIHQWIYSNLRRKWAALRRRPERLAVMFTGYHATEAMVSLALRRAGLEAAELRQLALWTPQMLHSLVAHFVRVRFPVLVALNKLDAEHAAANVAAARARLPHEAIVALSAHTEQELLRLRREGRLQYSVGAPPTGDVPASIAAFLRRNNGSSGVPEALAAAAALRPCVRVFPVTNLDTLESFGPQRLAHCLLMRPGSTAESLYRALKRRRMLEGDFVRAATRSQGSGSKETPLRKDAALPQDAVVRVMTNRKSRWQGLHPQRHAAAAVHTDPAAAVAAH